MYNTDAMRRGFCTIMLSFDLCTVPRETGGGCDNTSRVANVEKKRV